MDGLNRPAKCGGSPMITAVTRFGVADTGATPLEDSDRGPGGA